MIERCQLSAEVEACSSARRAAYFARPSSLHEWETKASTSLSAAALRAPTSSKRSLGVRSELIKCSGRSAEKGMERNRATASLTRDSSWVPSPPPSNSEMAARERVEATSLCRHKGEDGRGWGDRQAHVTKLALMRSPLVEMWHLLEAPLADEAADSATVLRRKHDAKNTCARRCTHCQLVLPHEVGVRRVGLAVYRDDSIVQENRYAKGDRRDTRQQCNCPLRLSKRAARITHGDACQCMPQHQARNEAAGKSSEAAGRLHESQVSRWLFPAL